MKKWNKPELLSLGVENTFDGCFDSTTFGNEGSAAAHYCHKTNSIHYPPDNNKPEGDPPISHTRSEKCENTPHWHLGQKYSSCCCAS